MSNYTFLFGTQAPFYLLEITPASSLHYPEIFGNEWKNIIYFSERGAAECFGLNSTLEKMGEVGLKLLDRDFAEKHLAESTTVRQKFTEFQAKLQQTNIQQCSNEELAVLFGEHFGIFEQLISFFKYSRPEFFTKIEDKFRSILREKIHVDKVEEHFQLLTTPTELDEINKEELAWVKFMLTLPDPTGEHFEAHAHSHPFFFYNVKEQQEAITFLRDRFENWKSKSPEQLHQHRQRIHEGKSELHKQQSAILQEHQNQEVNYLSWLYQQTALDRLKNKVWSGFTFISLPLIKEIVKRLNIPFDDFWDAYGSADVQRALKENIVLSPDEIQKRRDFSLFWLREQDLIFASGDEAKDIVQQEIPEVSKISDKQEIKGTTASLGKVVGKVRVVPVTDLQNLSLSLKDFQKGEILVTQMTQPNMVVLCQQASAIVTDEGGMTSHAAVIAREFKIPCIVGTLYATKIFHDGDLVEVDANKGVVRKITPLT